MVTQSLATKLMIVNASISMWEGRKLDKAITRKTIADNNVEDADGLSVNKRIIHKDAFKGVQAAASAVRAVIYEHTLPWKDNGDRAIMRQMYARFLHHFHEAEQKFEAAKREFIDVIYPAAVAKASFNLGDAYDANDYPHADQLEDRFKLRLVIDAVSDPEDFRVKLDDATVDAIKADMEEAIGQRVHMAMGDVWSRLETMVAHFAERTSPDIQRFHDTTVTNLQELVTILPGLNLIGDPNIKLISAKLKETLCAYDPKDLRKNKDVRAAAKAEAEEIMETMAGFMQAFK
jgi:hypothetical protein